ncbi:MAG: ferritin-like domain-containing protein [Nannocystaceae bacterium]|nr:ferritin-like domain-containing protein [Nannocystaceae bacterium]
MGWAQWRVSMLVAMGLASGIGGASGCVTRAIGGDDDGGEDGEDGDDGDDGLDLGEGSGHDLGSGDDGPQCSLVPAGYEEIGFCRPPGPDGCSTCADEACQIAAEAASGFCAPTYDGLLCGPIEQQGQCCYLAHVIDQGCAGRPLLHDGVACMAEAIVRDDWRTDVAPDARAGTGSVRAQLAVAWRDIGLAEHASIASFARFVLDLLAVGAPAELVVAAQRAMGDEVVHARLAFGLASRYGGVAVGPGPLRQPAAAVRTLEEIVVAAVVEGCVGETIAAARAEHARHGVRDEAVAGVLAVIARDERRHAQLAWRFVSWAVRRHPELQRAVARAFATVDVSGAGAGCDDDPRLRAHGVLAVEESLALAREIVEEVVLPCAAALLAPRGDADEAATTMVDGTSALA